MSVALALALLSCSLDEPDPAACEVSAALDRVMLEAVEPPSEAVAARQAAAYLRLVYELRGETLPEPAVADRASLLAYFNQIRGIGRGRVSEQRLVETAIDGLVAATGQPVGGYHPNDFTDLLQKAGPAGIGISSRIADGFPVVTVTTPGGPSDGLLRRGDVVRAVDGVSVEGISRNPFNRLMRGPAGSRVTLTIVRDDAAPVDVAITRALPLTADAVTARTQGNVGIVKVTRFDRDTSQEVNRAIEHMREHRPEPTGYILDLRGNMGGLLDVAPTLADLFLERGPIGSQRGTRPADVERHFAGPGDVTGGAPLVVLVDSGTASGAEIVAAALQDGRRARVVGSRTFGNAVIVTAIPISPRTLVMLPTSYYYRAGGGAIENVGVEPDLAVPAAPGGEDAALAAALALLAEAPR